jgi:uncharacterized protein
LLRANFLPTVAQQGLNLMMRSIPRTFDPKVVAAIDQRLNAVEADNGVKIAIAVESGSRAWGFESPDSDYDCRFIFIRPIEQHLSPWQARDVIETPLDPVMDVNGWELGKALKLVLKGNAVINEWLRSPVVYRGNSAFHADLSDFATQFTDRTLIARHYLHLGERQRQTYFADGKHVKLKKVFYALRPAAALRWLRLHEDQAIPPMHFPTLMQECNPPIDVDTLAQDLMAQKAATRELGSAAVPEPIVRFIDIEFALAHEAFEKRFVPVSPEGITAADAMTRQHAYWLVN